MTLAVGTADCITFLTFQLANMWEWKWPLFQVSVNFLKTDNQMTLPCCIKSKG